MFWLLDYYLLHTSSILLVWFSSNSQQWLKSRICYTQHNSSQVKIQPKWLKSRYEHQRELTHVCVKGHSFSIFFCSMCTKWRAGIFYSVGKSCARMKNHIFFWWWSGLSEFEPRTLHILCIVLTNWVKLTRTNEKSYLMIQ